MNILSSPVLSLKLSESSFLSYTVFIFSVNMRPNQDKETYLYRSKQFQLYQPESLISKALLQLNDPKLLFTSIHIVNLHRNLSENSSVFLRHAKLYEH